MPAQRDALLATADARLGSHRRALSPAAWQSAGVAMPRVKARRLAAAIPNCMCSGSEASKAIGWGSRLGGDQKGTPCEVVASGGKLKRSCAILQGLLREGVGQGFRDGSGTGEEVEKSLRDQAAPGGAGCGRCGRCGRGSRTQMDWYFIGKNFRY